MPLEKQRINGRVKSYVVHHWERTMASDRATNYLIIVLVLAAALGFLGIAYLATHPLGSLAVRDKLNQLPAAAVITEPFVCEDGRSIIAVFSNREVRIALSDGREITLPEVAAVSGARYANPDGSFVFGNVGATAFVEEFGRKTFSLCRKEE